MDQGVALVIAAAIGATPAVIAARALSRKVAAVDEKVGQVDTHVGQVHTEVKTGNALKVGESVDAAETRRVEAMPHDERTATEQHHLDTAPPPEPPQGPAR